MATREQITTALTDLKDNEIDVYIVTNGNEGITGTAHNAVLTEVKEAIDLVNENTFNTDSTGSDTSDIIPQGIYKQFVLTVNDITARDALLVGTDPVIDDGQLITVKSNANMNTEVFMVQSGIFYSLFEVNAPRITAESFPTHVDDATAGLAGLITNDIYKTPTGELRYKL